jgi:2-polyprenyl-6-methoxyphenol hydroxylase-like FAD-dependent oxidoreductase
LALLLSQHGIPSLVLEAWDRLDERLRATQYGVPATRIFRRAGLLEDFRAASIPSFPYICWRSVNDVDKRLIGIDLTTVQDEEDRMTILPLNEILKIMYRHCKEKGKGLIDIKFNHKVTDVGQDEARAWADVEVGASGEAKTKLRFEADYLIGCDGGSSTVRKCLFGRDWPGETFACRLMVQNVSLPFCGDLPSGFPTNSADSSRSFMMGLRSMVGTVATI